MLGNKDPCVKRKKRKPTKNAVQEKLPFQEGDKKTWFGANVKKSRANEWWKLAWGGKTGK